ncbi:hypothetical protein ADL12_04320 [Streptomyces regalis]|uniref:Uncharacterized protein n=1 Tax=Streptomyces regalis TaxID=68262 RepID=A0A0X3VKG3_9ACTN|nr:hypothetical protein ADL12_04320 [Streptomyces regalis]
MPGPVRVRGVQRGGHRVPGLGTLSTQRIHSAFPATRQLHELQQTLGEHHQMLRIGQRAQHERRRRL